MASDRDPEIHVTWDTYQPVKIVRIVGIRHVTDETERAVEFYWTPVSVGQKCVDAPVGQLVSLYSSSEGESEIMRKNDHNWAIETGRFAIAHFTRYDDGWRIMSIEKP